MFQQKTLASIKFLHSCLQTFLVDLSPVTEEEQFRWVKQVKNGTESIVKCTTIGHLSSILIFYWLLVMISVPITGNSTLLIMQKCALAIRKFIVYILQQWVFIHDKSCIYVIIMFSWLLVQLQNVTSVWISLLKFSNSQLWPVELYYHPP